MNVALKKRKPLTLKRLIRRRMISGLLVVIPLGLTVFILRFLYDLTAGRMEPVIRMLFEPLPEYILPAASLLFLTAIIYGAGLAANLVIGKKCIAAAEALLDRIPLVKTVYGASKQVVQTVSLQDEEASFKSVVIVDFPMPGMKSLAFVTGRVRLQDDASDTFREHYRVFVPTTPNPTSGYLEFVPVDEAEASGITVEEALKTVMSAGLVMPESLGPAPSAHDIAPLVRSVRTPSDVIAVKPARAAAGKLKALPRRPLFSGVAVIVPAGATLFVLKLLYDFTAGHIAPYIRAFIAPMPDYASPAVATLLLAALVYLIGMAAGVVVGRKAIRLLESAIQRIPFVKTVYSASKQIVQALAVKKRQAEPKTPVMVEFPRRGMKCIGFSMGTTTFQDGRVFHRVFVPTTPNITVGLLQLAAPEDVYWCQLSLDEAVRIVVSGGILGPDCMVLTRASQAPQTPAATASDDDDDEWDDDWV